MVHRPPEVEPKHVRFPLRAPRILRPALIAFAAVLACAPTAVSGEEAGTAAPVAEPTLPAETSLSEDARKEQVKKWCEAARKEIEKLDWKIDPCDRKDGSIAWRVGGTSVEGRPLLFAEFGKASDGGNTTLVLSSVHGDEITPLYLGIQLAHWLIDHKAEIGNAHVVIAPMINPDGFYRKPRTRTNARGVDINRNFPTRDWNKQALKAWKVKYRSDPRRFPGSAPSSEPETTFQEELIRVFKPQKILSVHSPLNHLDYDGPSAITLSKFPRDYVRECLKLRARLKAVSTGFFPGSLGNYAGQELGIPTLTLELPSADSRKAKAYWEKFSQGIKAMIQFEVPNYARFRHPVPPSLQAGS
jgi:protein MpaA